jgi:hypothetical protein
VKRLDDAESDLCLIDGKDEVNTIFEVPIRDITTADGTGSSADSFISIPLLIVDLALQQQNVHSPAKLTKWLGMELETNANNPNMQQLVAKKRDPRCRFM